MQEVDSHLDLIQLRKGTISVPLFVSKFHKNLTRVNSLAICASVVHESRGASLKQLSDRYTEILTTPVLLVAGDAARVEKYIGSRALIRKYSSQTGPKTLQSISDRIKSENQRIEIQDWFLSEPDLRSHSGAERSMTSARTVEVCAELDFLRLPGGTLQTLGRVLVALGRSLEVVPILDRNGTNPFATKPAINALILYQFLRNDIAFISALLSEFSDEVLSFYRGLGLRMGTILARVESNTKRTLANRNEFLWLEKQKQYAKRLTTARNSGKSKSGSTIESAYRPIEDMLIPRCEFLVDCGILKKPVPTEYGFELTDQGEQFKDSISDPSFDLERDFFSVFGDLCATTLSRVPDKELLEHLEEAYLALRNPARYAPITETVLYANCLSIIEGSGRVVEIEKAKSILADMTRKPGTPVRIVSDRHRRPGAFRNQEAGKK